MIRIKQLIIAAGIIIMVISTSGQPGIITKSFLIERLAGRQEKKWYKCGSITKADRIQGEKRYVFRRSNMKFSIETCNYLRKWIADTTYSWNIEMKNDNSRNSFKGYVLKIGNKDAAFRFDDKFKNLYLKLYNWESLNCLFY